MLILLDRLFLLFLYYFLILFILAYVCCALGVPFVTSLCLAFFLFTQYKHITYLLKIVIKTDY